jgi:hypothetical protein
VFITDLNKQNCAVGPVFFSRSCGIRKVKGGILPPVMADMIENGPIVKADGITSMSVFPAVIHSNKCLVREKKRFTEEHKSTQ